MQGWLVRKERGDVAVFAHTQKQEVERWGQQRGVFARGRLAIGTFRLHAVHAGGRFRQAREQIVIHQPEVAARIVGWHGALVPEKENHPGPGNSRSMRQ